MEINKKVLRGKVRRLPCDPCCMEWFGCCVLDPS